MTLPYHSGGKKRKKKKKRKNVRGSKRFIIRSERFVVKARDYSHETWDAPSHNVLTVKRKFGLRLSSAAFASLLFARPICILVITVFAYHRETFPDTGDYREKSDEYVYLAEEN